MKPAFSSEKLQSYMFFLLFPFSLTKFEIWRLIRFCDFLFGNRKWQTTSFLYWWP